MANKITITAQPPQDEIVISLIEQRTVTHDTVRVNVTVVAQRDDQTNETTLRGQIRAALRQFIDTSDWRFTGVSRQRGATRFEQVSVQAVTRVSEAENMQLVDRANAVSKQGLELVNPSATYALPHSRVREINRELRVSLVKQAYEECLAYNEATGRDYRVATVVFADTPQAAGLYAQNNVSMNRASSAYASAPPPGSGGQEPDVDEGAPDLAVSERFWVAAQVTLATAPTD